jgi:hypothetical protein
MAKIKLKDEYEKHACEFINESECEEELDDDGEDIDKVGEEHFEEGKDSWK